MSIYPENYFDYGKSFYFLDAPTLKKRTQSLCPEKRNGQKTRPAFFIIAAV